MDRGRYLVTGATGQLGALVVEQLLRVVPPDHVVVTVREPQRAQHLLARGVAVRQADFDQPATLPAVFDGADTLLLISTNGLDTVRLQRHHNAIDAAARVGVARIVYTSQVDPDPTSPYSLAGMHHATEEYLRSRAPTWTIVRNGFYADLQLDYARQAVLTGVLATPADGPVAYAARADLAEALATVLTNPSTASQALTLTGSEALDHTALALRLARLVGRPITRQVVDDDIFAAQLRAHSVPEHFIGWTLGMFQAARQGRYAQITPTLAEWLGRPPTPIEQVLAPGLGASTPLVQ